MNRCVLFVLLCSCMPVLPLRADAPASKLLLIGSGPDGHPAQTHEYMAGLKVIAKCLKNVPGLEITTIRADEPWKEGPELIARADGVVLFLSEGARWMNHDPKRREALAKMAKRGGGIVVLHWAMGTKDAANIDGCLQLLGGCHGGPDRKYKVLETDAAIVDRKHPIAAGIKDFHVKDEFYYRLKFVKADKGVHPLVQVTIDGQRETVAWSWERPDGGRSFGFSGLHFHDNWKLQAYRRLVAQGVLWTLKKPIPKDGLPVEVAEEDLKLGGEPLPRGVLARLGSPRLRHAGQIGPAVFSPDGKSLATGGWDQTVRIWDVASGRQSHLLLGHQSYLVALAFSPDGKRLASGSAHEPERLRLWDLASGKQLWTHRPLGRHVLALAFSPDGKTIALGDHNGCIALLDAAIGKERFRLEGKSDAIVRLAFAPDGGSLAVCNDERQVMVWNLTTRKERWSVTVPLPFRVISTADFAADGKMLRISGRRLHDRGGDLHVSAVSGTVDATTGKLLRGHTHETDTSGVAAVALSPDGKLIAALCVNGMIHVWTAETGDPVRSFRDSSYRASASDNLVFSPDGRVLAVAGWELDRAIHLWDVSTGKAIHRGDGHEAIVRAIALTPDGARIATGGKDRTIHLWDSSTGKLLGTFSASHDVLSLAFSPDGRTLAVGDAIAEARLWDVRSGKLSRKLNVESCSFVAFSFLPNGGSLVSGHRSIYFESEVSEMDGCIRLWNAATGKEQLRFNGPALDSSASPALRVCPGGREIVALHADQSLRSWPMEGGKGKLLLRACPPGVHFLSSAFSPDGTLFAGNTSDGPVHVWNLARKGCAIPMSIPDGFGQALAFSPDNRFLVTAGMRMDADAPAAERTIRLWEVASGEEVFRVPLPPGNAVSCLMFHPDGRSLVAAMADTTILIWNTNPVPSIAQLRGEQLERAWTDLAGEPRTAYRAMNLLASSPSEAAAFLSTKLRPATPPRDGLLAGLLADLDRDEFAVRERAEQQLEKLGGLAEPALRQTLDGHPSLEVRRRIERLLAKLDAPAKPSTAELREGRVIAVLEWMGTSAARHHLRTLADGAAGSRLTRAAKAALVRLADKKAPGG